MPSPAINIDALLTDEEENLKLEEIMPCILAATGIENNTRSAEGRGLPIQRHHQPST